MHIMRRKVIQDFANVFCQMFMCWRLGIPNNLDILETLGSGVLSIDVQTGACVYNATTALDLPIAHELHTWFIEALVKHHIPPAAIISAELTVAFHVRVEHKRRVRNRYLAFHCRSHIATDEKAYIGEAHEPADQPPLGLR